MSPRLSFERKCHIRYPEWVLIYLLEEIVPSSFAEALDISRDKRITILRSFPPLLYIIPRRERRRRSSYTRFIVIHRYLASKKGSLGDSGQSRRRAPSYNSTRVRASSRIEITITTYIYVGESSGSRRDPFTARNREFRVTLRGLGEKASDLVLYTYTEWLLCCKLLRACK